MFSARTLMLISLVMMATGAMASEQSDSQNRPVRFAVIGDRTSEHQPGVYGSILQEIARLKPDLVMTVGDAIEGYTEDTTVLKERWEEYLGLVATISAPMYFTPGNNDAQGDRSVALYERYLGPLYHSFDYDQLHFIVLDNSRIESSGEFEPEQLDWLKADLESHRDAQATFVFMHKPFWYNSTGFGVADTLHTLFVAYGVDAVMSGHFHNYFSGEFDGILYTGLGSSGGGIRAEQPGPGYHFAWVTVAGENISIAPINAGSVMAWDVVTHDELFLYNRIRYLSTNFADPASVSEDLKVVNDKVAVTIDNLTDAYTWSDSLRWDIPDGWSIEPAAILLYLTAGGTAEATFTVSCSGDLYPLPSFSLAAPYTESDTCHISEDLHVTRQANCRRRAEEITIDGMLTENCWSSPVTTLLGNDSKLTTGEPTSFYFAHDDDFLYLAAHCVESQVEAMVSDMTERDGAVYTDDCVGFMIQPDLNQPLAYQVYVNALGIVYDQRLKAKADGYYAAERGWNGAIEIAAIVGEKNWTVEIKIPLAEIGATTDRATEWGINFRRKQQRNATASHFQRPWSYNTKTYGRLLFD